MKKSIVLNEQLIEYTLYRSPRARSLRLSVRLDGSCILTVPRRISEDTATRFLIRQADWLLKKISYFQKIAAPALPMHNKILYAAVKPTAERIIQAKIRYYNEQCHVAYNRVCIRYQKSRWGSCSGNKNLNFNYRLSLLPDRLMDYVIIHELCHLKELNHSTAFWKEVGTILPNYRALRSELRNQPM